MAETLAAALVASESSALVTAGFIIGGNAALVNTALLLTASYAQGQDQRRRLRNQARDAANDAARDRQQMLRSAVSPRPIVYGRAKVSGTVVYAQSTGSLGQYLHLVVALAGHECDSIESIYFNDVLLPTPDGSGNINSGVFSKTTTLSAMEQTASGSLALANTPTTITSVIQTDSSGNPLDAQTTLLALTTGYTLAGSTVTFVPGTSTGRTFQVNYEYQTSTSKVRVKKYLGASGQTADSDLVSESGGKWTSNHIGTGVCYLYVRLEYDQDVFGQIGVPNISAVLRGKKVLDTRTSTTAWSNNAALCIRDWLVDTTLGLGCTSAEAPTAETTTGANICDEEVNLYNTGTVTVTNASPNVVGSGTTWSVGAYAGQLFVSNDGVRYTILSVTDDTHLTLTANYGGGTVGGQAHAILQLRYTCNGVLGTEAAPLENLRSLLGSMAGTAVWVQGRWLVRAGAYVTPVLTITEDYLSDGSISIIPRASRRDQCNRVSGTFVDPNNSYAEVQFPPVVNATYKAADGALELTREIVLPFANDKTRAQRMAKIVMEKARQAITLRIPCNHKAYDLAPSDTVQVTLSRYGWSAKVFEVRSRKYTPAVGLEYTLQETASTLWTWNLGEATVYSAAAATSLPNPFATPAVLASLACDSGSTVNSAIAASIVPRGLVTWTASTDVFVRQGGRVEIEWKLWTDTVWQKGPPTPGDATSAYISPLTPSGITLVRVRAVNAAARVGPWSTITHTVAAGGQLGGGNLLANSSFEVDTDANGLADSWTAYSAGTTGAITNSILSTSGINGGKAQKVAAAGLGTADGDRIGVSQEINVQQHANKRATVSAYAYASVAGAEISMNCDFYDSTPTFISGSRFDNLQPSVASGTPIVRYTGAMTVPATAKTVVVTLWGGQRTGGTGAMDFIVDAVQFEIGALTAYAPKTDEILAGAVGTTQIADGAATTGKIASEAATEVRTPVSSSSVTVTDALHVPDNLSFRTVLLSSTFTPAVDCTAEVTCSGNLSFTTSSNGGNYEGALQHGIYTGSGSGTLQADVNWYTPDVGSSKTYKPPLFVTTRLALTGGASVTFSWAAAKGNSGDTVSGQNLLMNITLVKR